MEKNGNETNMKERKAVIHCSFAGIFHGNVSGIVSLDNKTCFFL